MNTSKRLKELYELFLEYKSLKNNKTYSFQLVENHVHGPWYHVDCDTGERLDEPPTYEKMEAFIAIIHNGEIVDKITDYYPFFFSERFDSHFFEAEMDNDGIRVNLEPRSLLDF